MKVSITGRFVIFDDLKGNEIHITTDQLLELFSVLCVEVKQDDGLLFENLEFTV
uniref:Uncharacterized protein n=1 Tax=viral metagenome TaxID=1070528 RepID=A0A6H1Z7F8_9ZZZZ